MAPRRDILGITFDHARTSRVVLSRSTGDWFEVELWRTPDGGPTWMTPIAVVYVHGTASSFRNFQTVVRMDVARPGTPP